MTVINTNISANIARDAIGRNNRAMSTSMERLSTGLRINSAKDDAAGLAIANRMAGQISGLNMAARNANDAMSMVQTIEGATGEINNMLIRMRELAVQSASGTYSTSDRQALDLEFGALMDEMNRIAENTKWNGIAVLDGDGVDNENADVESVSIQLGASASQSMALEFKSWVPQVAVDVNGDQSGDVTDATESAFGTAVFYYGDDNDATNNAAGEVAGDGEEARIDILSVANASNAITQLDNAITGATAERAKLGSYMSRLQYASDNLSNVSTNLDQSRSRIQDADYAVETTNLARTQIIAQASTAMLAQANQSKQTVLALLQ
jgi:flagellin